MTNQEIYNRFFFLEGLVSEGTFKQIAEEAIKIHIETYEETADVCDGLSKLYYNSSVGFDMGYTKGTIRAGKEIRKLIQGGRIMDERNCGYCESCADGNYYDCSVAQNAINAIAALTPELEDSIHGKRFRCQQCGYAWGAGLDGKEGHAMNCAYVIATSVPHTPPKE